LIGYDGGRRALTVHRALADPLADGQPATTRIHDLLIDALPVATFKHVLDAGCGMGGTMIALATKSSASFTGVTLSPHQAEIGRRAIARTGLENRIEIRVQSYDEPADRVFDAALAIESLAHSSAPGTSLRAIAARIAPGGWLAIVDDMPEEAARGTADLAVFQAGWRLPALWGAAAISAALRDNGLTVVADHDLTSELRPRTPAQIARLEQLNRALRAIAPTRGLRQLLDSYGGGLALERLYRQGLMTYRLFIARKT
jgi:cyclopropane fatty-acyl-phospholipid synthase-like methyltransferase